MNILFDQSENDAVDSNGTEPLSKASPGWFQGTGNELGRGIKNIGVLGERLAGQADSSAADALGVNQYLTRDGNVAKIHDIDPTPPEKLPQFEKPDADNSGAAAIILGDLMQSAPVVAGAIVNPLAGFAAGVVSGAAHAQEEAAKMNLSDEAGRGYAAISALSEGIGGAMPGIGGIGERALLKYGSRFVTGGAANVALSEADQWSRAAVLDAYGYQKQAAQLRQWDTQQAMASFLMGGFFNLAGGRARDRDVTASDVQPEKLPEQMPDSVDGTVPPATENFADSAPQFTTLDGYRLTRGDVKEAKSDIANAQRHLDRLDAERAEILANAPSGSGKALADARAVQQARLTDIDKQRQFSQQVYDNASSKLDSHYAYGRQRIDALNADAAMHTVLHDNYVTESAPGLAVDTQSESAHVRAMDSAMESINAGKAVDISDHFGGDNAFLVHGDLNGGILERQQLAGDLQQRTDRAVMAAENQSLPEKDIAEPVAGVISSEVAEPFAMLRAQTEALRETHPELADAMAPHIDALEAEHTLSTAEAQQYDIAAACALTYGQ
ncbi:hypothetical protein [Pantoea ananatis]|uniref:hypothetical protein n=1 Tax=Pantoea ananas TaxID=553 RepID=UPI000E27AF6D|nr:hypothetical protein [Pantoea ananatis]REF09763.1 hypothetical protein C7428_2057 [Pantoea ananatis]